MKMGENSSRKDVENIFKYALFMAQSQNSGFSPKALSRNLEFGMWKHMES